MYLHPCNGQCYTKLALDSNTLLQSYAAEVNNQNLGYRPSACRYDLGQECMNIFCLRRHMKLSLWPSIHDSLVINSCSYVCVKSPSIVDSIICSSIDSTRPGLLNKSSVGSFAGVKRFSSWSANLMLAVSIRGSRCSKSLMSLPGSSALYADAT